MRKIFKWFRQKLVELFHGKISYVVLICGWLAFFSILVALVWYWPLRKIKYIPEEIPQSEAVAEIYEPEYSYYLDYSPSMIGFFSVESGIMAQLGEALSQVNQRNLDNYFYYCSDKINWVGEENFYRGMQSDEMIREYYSSLASGGISDTAGSTGAGSNSKLKEELDNIDLSGIFSLKGSDYRDFGNDEENLNVIITDLNFFRSSGDEVGHNERLERFALALAREIETANVCIYNIQGNFSGRLDDEYSDAAFAASYSLHSESVLLIVEAKNREVFDRYLERLEQAFDNKNISYGNKLLLRAEPLEGRRELTVNADVFEGTELDNFNFDQTSLKGQTASALGLRLVRADNTLSNARIPVAALGTDVSYAKPQDTEGTSRIQTEYRVFYPGLIDYEEYLENNLVESCSAAVSQYNDMPYLYLNLMVNANVLPEKNWLSGDYYVVDIRFFVDQLEYALPAWVEEMNTVDANVEEGKKLNVAAFFEKILKIKGASYELLSESERYIGNIVVFVNY